MVIESVNGRPIGSIPDAIEAFERPVDGFHTVLLEPNANRREIVLDAEQFEDGTREDCCARPSSRQDTSRSTVPE